MGNVFGVGATGIQAGGLIASAQAAAMTGGSVTAVFAPLLSVAAAIGAAITMIATGMLLK